MATMVASMPGDWSRTSEEDEQLINYLQVPRVNTQVGRHSSRIPTSASPSPRVDDELFFDIQVSASITEVSEAIMPPYLVFEPAIGSDGRDEQLDWWRYEPPQELFRVQEGTSEELSGLIPQSIERLKAQQAEEEERRVAVAREARTLARSTRTTISRRNNATATITNLDPLSEATGETNSSNLSATSLVSNDSGYESTTLEVQGAPKVSALTSSNTNVATTTTTRWDKGLFSFSSLFRRKDNSTSNLAVPDSNPAQYDWRPTGLRDHPNSSFPVPETSVSGSSTVECVSCLDDFNSREMVKLTCHSYCADCFQRLINTALETEAQWPAKCCLNPIPSTTILPHLSHDTKAKFNLRTAEWSIPPADRIYCSHSDCNRWISPRRVHQGTNVAKCQACLRKTCVLCRGEAHRGIDCPSDPALQQTIHLAEEEGWKRCYQCNAFVEHNQGCRHMTCRCKAEFCYICCARWRTCSCTDAQLVTAHQAAEARRMVRVRGEREAAAEVARQEARAEEERMLVQMVEMFEREEAERAAAEAEAQRLRDEEARRIREEEERVIEEQRIAAVGQRFQELNAELEGLNEIQRVLIAERYEFETEVQQKERQDALDALSFRYIPEKDSLSLASQKTVFDAESAYKQEYRSRLSEEKRVEKEYIAQLQAFWNGKEDGELQVRQARDDLRGDQDREYRFWDAYRKKQVFAIKEGEKRKMEALIMKHENEVRIVEDRASVDSGEWRQKVNAEAMWVDAVVRERVNMLQEMEVVEYGRV